ncbi:MAG TPA: glycoside hydrolase family 6 protein, partial [Polyangiaceae bacterium]|nr:glycoside hydrolase family 6 protein [Polyangiaceae bacterium]
YPMRPHQGSLLAIPLALSLAVACIPKRHPADAVPHQIGGNPIAGETLYVDPNTAARHTAENWRSSRPADAAAMDKIANQAAAEWLGEWSGNVRNYAKQRVSIISKAGALPVFIAYDAPDRDCGQYSAGGADNTSEYLQWIADLGNGIGEHKAVVILEPDLLGLIEKCTASNAQASRYAMLREAVKTLKAYPKLVLYLDAGNPNWIAAPDMAKRLQNAGIEYADGFSLNVSNYVDTPANLAYGKAISALLGGVHFVIDTSRNGNGAPEDKAWCNPPGRALGLRPTANTGEPLCDAFLWLKRPGESDGACNGGPRAGDFWPVQALDLAKGARW